MVPWAAQEAHKKRVKRSPNVPCRRHRHTKMPFSGLKPLCRASICLWPARRNFAREVLSRVFKAMTIVYLAVTGGQSSHLLHEPVFLRVRGERSFTTPD